MLSHINAFPCSGPLLLDGTKISSSGYLDAAAQTVPTGELVTFPSPLTPPPRQVDGNKVDSVERVVINAQLNLEDDLSYGFQTDSNSVGSG